MHGTTVKIKIFLHKLTVAQSVTNSRQVVESAHTSAQHILGVHYWRAKVAFHLTYMRSMEQVELRIRSPICIRNVIFVFGATAPKCARVSSFARFLRSHTTTHHTRYDSSGRVISSSQRPIPNNTQHSQQTNIHDPVGFEPTVSAGERQ